MMDVADVLRDRMHEAAGGQRALSVSVAISLTAHAVAGTFIIFTVARWAGHPAETPKNVMTITIGGAGEGPRNGGMTAAAARPVQVATPPEEMPKREAVRPPAAATPEMTLPTNTRTRASKPAPPKPTVRQAPDQARGSTPARGPQVSAGSALAYTGARGQGFGLSTGGGSGGGSSLDVADFCCPDYIVTMVDRIRSIWDQNQGATGQCVIKFTIQRNGQIAQSALESSSGSSVLDNAALRAVRATRALPPLPDAFPNPTLTVHLNFQYK